jgi:hypothetical protein
MMVSIAAIPLPLYLCRMMMRYCSKFSTRLETHAARCEPTASSIPSLPLQSRQGQQQQIATIYSNMNHSPERHSNIKMTAWRRFAMAYIGTRFLCFVAIGLTRWQSIKLHYILNDTISTSISSSSTMQRCKYLCVDGRMVVVAALRVVVPQATAHHHHRRMAGCDCFTNSWDL